VHAQTLHLGMSGNHAEIEEVGVSLQLTERERQVALLASQGIPNKVIARELGITDGTVKAHLNSIFTKTGVSNRTGLVLRRENLKKRFGAT